MVLMEYGSDQIKANLTQKDKMWWNPHHHISSKDEGPLQCITSAPQLDVRQSRGKATQCAMKIYSSF